MGNSRSTALRNFTAQYGSLAAALANGVLDIYAGTRPDNADQAANQKGNAVKLATITVGGNGFTPEVLPQGKLTLSSGGSGSVDGITVGGVQILPFGSVAFNTSLAQTALDIIASINAGSCFTGYSAASGGSGVIIIFGLPGLGPFKTIGTGGWPGIYPGGANFATLPINPTTTTIVATVNNHFGDTNLISSVAPANGIPMGAFQGGGIFGPGTPLGVATLQTLSCLATGTITWVRFKGSVADSDGLDSSHQYMRWDMDAAANGTMEVNTAATPSTTAGQPYVWSNTLTTITEN